MSKVKPRFASTSALGRDEGEAVLTVSRCERGSTASSWGPSRLPGHHLDSCKVPAGPPTAFPSNNPAAIAELRYLPADFLMIVRLVSVSSSGLLN